MDPHVKEAEEDARRAYSANEWTYPHSRDRIKAIYPELKRIDAEHARAVGFQPRRAKRQTLIDPEGEDAQRADAQFPRRRPARRQRRLA